MKKKKLKAFVGGTLFFVILAVSSVNAEVKRPFAGTDRFDTTVKIASEGWTSSDNAILASGKNGNLVDALTAAPLASKLKAPIFLTNGTSFDTGTYNKIKALHVKTIYITSGENAIPKTLESKLKSAGVSSIIRLGGTNRYETAVNIAKAIGVNGKIMVARGDKYADALSAAAIAAREQIPILLSNQDSLPSETQKYIASNKISMSYVLGLSGALSDSVKNSLPEAKRIGGNDRYATNIAVIKEFEDSLNFNQVYVASGEDRNLVDALAGSPLAAKNSAPILLSPSSLPAGTANYLKGMLNKSSEVKIFGGSGAVTEAVSKDITAIQQNMTTNVVNGDATVSAGVVSVLKNIQVNSVPLSNAAKYRLEGSSSIQAIGQPVSLVMPKGNINVYICDTSNQVIAKGSLNIADSGEHIIFKLTVAQ